MIWASDWNGHGQGDPKVDPEPAGGITYRHLAWERVGIPQEEPQSVEDPAWSWWMDGI